MTDINIANLPVNILPTKNDIAIVENTTQTCRMSLGALYTFMASSTTDPITHTYSTPSPMSINSAPNAGWFNDWDLKAANHTLVQNSAAESTTSGSIGSFRDADSLLFKETDSTDYYKNNVNPVRRISNGRRTLVQGAVIHNPSQPNQYKDIVGLETVVVGQIMWPDRGVSGCNTQVIQYGVGICDNEFSVQNPYFAPQQSMSMAALQLIVESGKAASDSTHKARGAFVVNLGHAITAGVEVMSTPISGAYNGRYQTALKMNEAVVDGSGYGIEMPTDTGDFAGTRIKYDTGDYSQFDRINNRYDWMVSSTPTMRVSTNGIEAPSGIQLSTSTTKPTADSSNRGKIWITRGGVGVADIIEVCVKTASDTYIWQAM